MEDQKQTVDVEKLTTFYSLAKTEYDDIRDLYNQVLEYTDPFAQIDATKSEITKIKNRRKLYPSITRPIDILVNFVMNTLLARGTQWLQLELNEHVTDGDVQNPVELGENVKKDIKAEFEENTKTNYKYIEATNYFTIIYRSLKDAISLGTGCYRVYEESSEAHPFTYQYQSVNNLYVKNDIFGDPNYVFYYRGKVTISDLRQLFPQAKVESSGTQEDYVATKDVVEFVYPIFDEEKSITKFMYGAASPDFKEIYFNELKDFNPFVVFRSDSSTETSYGIGLSIGLLDTYADLVDYINLRKVHANKIVDPPGGFVGNPKLFMKLRMTKGARNFLGTGNQGDTVDYKQLYTSGSVVEISEDIKTLKEDIKEVFMTDPIGQTVATTNRSAAEMQIRYKLFRDKFSGMQEKIQSELLSKTFTIPLQILINKGIIKFDKLIEATKGSSEQTISDVISNSYIRFVNKMSKQSDQEDVSTLNSYISIISQFKPEIAGYSVKSNLYIDYVADKLGIPKKIRYSTEELEKIEQGLEQQKQQMQQQAYREEAAKVVPQQQAEMQQQQQAQQVQQAGSNGGY